MLPGVGPGAVGEHIANGIAGDGLTVVTRQQIAPGGVAIGIGNRINNRAKRSSGVGILLAAGDIAPVVISPNPGLACRLVVLPGQMVNWAADILVSPGTQRSKGLPFIVL